MRKYRRSITDYIMRDLRLKDEWKRRIERQKNNKNKVVENVDKGVNNG